MKFRGAKIERNRRIKKSNKILATSRATESRLSSAGSFFLHVQIARGDADEGPKWCARYMIKCRDDDTWAQVRVKRWRGNPRWRFRQLSPKLDFDPVVGIFPSSEIGPDR